MDVESFPSLEGLLTTLLSRNGLPGLKSPPIMEEAHNPMGMASNTSSVKLELIDGSTLQLFLKIRRKESDVEKIDKVFRLFTRENIMYGTILPLLSEFQKENKMKEPEFQLCEMFPKFYGAGEVRQDLFLVFDNILHNTGRYVTNKTDFHSKDQILLCLRQLAVFHGVSYCFQLKSKRDILAEFPILEEPVFHPDRMDHIRSFFQGLHQKHLQIIKVVRDEYLKKNATVLSKIERICTEEDLSELIRTGGQLMEDISDLIRPEDHSVITHGDFHMWNIAFQGPDPPRQAIFFDLQVSRYCSVMTDVVQYLYQVTTTQERSLFLSDYLTAYAQSFSSTCSSLGVPGNHPPSSLSWLTSQCSRLSLWGLMYGQMVLPRFVEDNETFGRIDLALKGENNGEEIVNIINESGSNIWWAIQLLIDMINEHSKVIIK